MSQKPGSLFGGILLTAGSCIGAGMLALPIVTGLAGFFPSLLLFFLAWLFMTLTGLLLVEVTGTFSHQVNMNSMMARTLGKWGQIASWFLYLFLFYSLLVAYISGSGSLVSGVFPISTWQASIFFVILFGTIVLFGTRQVDLWNRVLMGCKIVAFLSMVFLSFRYLQPTLLLHRNTSYMWLALPILVVSFGFHNMVPSLTAYMKGDLKRVRLTILGGSLLTLVIYLIWQILILGIVPIDGEFGIAQSAHLGREASISLAGTLGTSWMGGFGQAFAFFAILTSFLGQTLSLVHFLADAFKVKHEKHESIFLSLLALGPPLLFSLFSPGLFLKALSFAGGWAAILFGIFPVCMVWIGRYRKQVHTPYRVCGGKPLLIAIFLFSIFITGYQVFLMVSPRV